MHASLVPTAEIFACSERLFARALEGVEDAQLCERPGGGNSLLWMAGHVTGARCQLAGFLGAPVEYPWADLFARGNSPYDCPDWPRLEPIVAKWNEVSAALRARFATLTEEELDRPAGDAPSLNGRVSGAITLLAFHDGYHVGQMGYVRRLLGLGRLVG